MREFPDKFVLFRPSSDPVFPATLKGSFLFLLIQDVFAYIAPPFAVIFTAGIPGVSVLRGGYGHRHPCHEASGKQTSGRRDLEVMLCPLTSETCLASERRP